MGLIRTHAALTTAQADELARISHAADGAYVEVYPVKGRRGGDPGLVRVGYGFHGRHHELVLDDEGHIVDGKGPVELHMEGSQ